MKGCKPERPILNAIETALKVDLHRKVSSKREALGNKGSLKLFFFPPPDFSACEKVTQLPRSYDYSWVAEGSV